MTQREAVQKLVAYVDQAPAYDDLAQAARLVLRALKEQTKVGDSLAALVGKIDQACAQGIREGTAELFDGADLPQQPYRHPEAPGR